MRLEDMKDAFPKMPEEIKYMIEKEVAEQIENSEMTEKDVDKINVINYRKKKKNTAHRMLIASLVAALALATTVCAGVVYQMHNEAVGTYGLKTTIEGPDASVQETATQSTEAGQETKAEYVKLNVSYLPDGMIQSEEGKYSFEDNYMQGGISMDVYSLTPGEKISDIWNTDVAEYEETEIGGRPALYMEKTTSEAKKLYVVYAEQNYLLEMFIFPDISRDEAFKIAEGVTITPTEAQSDPDVIKVFAWNAVQEENNEKGEAVFPEEKQTFSKDEMKNTHAIGDVIAMDRNGLEETPGLTATVESVELSDDISILPEAMINEEVKASFDENGKLLPMTLSYIKSGDGVNSTDEVVKTRELPEQIVYVTVKYTNQGKETLENVMFNGAIALLEEQGDQMKIFNYDSNATEEDDGSWDYTILERTGFSQEIYLMDVTGGERGNNYIDSLAPGETVTVHLAFKVPEEKLDEMYLTLSNYGVTYQYDEESLKLGYVDIRQ